MTTSTAPHQALARRSLGVWIAPSLVGFVMLCLTGLFGFEEPNEWLLLLGAVLMLAAPAAVVVHLYLNDELTLEEKRIWIREFMSPVAASALADYLMTKDHRAAATKRAQERARRRRR